MIGDTCVFCQIVTKKIPVNPIYEDAMVISFLDHRPASEGHALVVPKKHIETIYDLSDEEIAHLFRIVRKVAVTIKKVIRPGGDKHNPTEWLSCWSAYSPSPCSRDSSIFGTKTSKHGRTSRREKRTIR